MTWFDNFASSIKDRDVQIINDSKTPSGRVHVGALRGVIIHDVVFRVLKEKNVPVRYLFGVDDYDPLDEIPAGQEEYFQKYLGVPLCNVPPLPESSAKNMSEHYIGEFFDVFEELGVDAEIYRTGGLYCGGKFNEAINVILNNASTVRQVYKTVSNSIRALDWYPFQAICENCGRIGTTKVHSFDGKEVIYTCQQDLVKWAIGCGYKGKVSPFDGKGKLPWKLEWVAKWVSFPVTIEGAGKDHNTKGGSRDVAVQCLRELFGQEPPQNIPYEFFLVGGAKMSSSKGVGASAREVADLLPPEVLRFLMLRGQPNKPVNFSLDEEYIVKLFNDFDRTHQLAYQGPRVREEERRNFMLSEVSPQGPYYDANFQIVTTLVQMPHLDLVKEIEKRKGTPLSLIEMRHLERRVQSAKYWLDNYASEEERIRIQSYIPSSSSSLSAVQRAFLNKLSREILLTSWGDDDLQSKIFQIARLTPIDQPLAFQAIYRVLLDRNSGPKAGSLIAFLNKDFIARRFSELSYSELEFWKSSSSSVEEFENWIQSQEGGITTIQARLRLLAFEMPTSFTNLGKIFTAGMGVIEFTVTLNDSKSYLKRVLFSQFKGFDMSYEKLLEEFQLYSKEFIQELNSKHLLSITIEGVAECCESFTNVAC